MKGNTFAEEIKQIEKFLEYRDDFNPKVSEAPVSWHLEHILLVINSIYTQLSDSKTSNYRNKFNFMKTLIFVMNSIPRGRGKSPKSVNPKKNVENAVILNHLHEAKKNLLLFDLLPSNSYFKHPYFGDLNKKQTKKFVKIHTNHHLKIIKDILRN